MLGTVGAVEMVPVDIGNPSARFEGTVMFPTSGHHGYTVRVRPRHPDLSQQMIPRLLTWA